jgi:hypothetical protein
MFYYPFQSCLSIWFVSSFKVAHNGPRVSRQFGILETDASDETNIPKEPQSSNLP